MFAIVMCLVLPMCILISCSSVLIASPWMFSFYIADTDITGQAGLLC